MNNAVECQQTMLSELGSDLCFQGCHWKNCAATANRSALLHLILSKSLMNDMVYILDCLSDWWTRSHSITFLITGQFTLPGETTRTCSQFRFINYPYIIMPIEISDVKRSRSNSILCVEKSERNCQPLRCDWSLSLISLP